MLKFGIELNIYYIYIFIFHSETFYAFNIPLGSFFVPFIALQWVPLNAVSRLRRPLPGHLSERVAATRITVRKSHRLRPQ